MRASELKRKSEKELNKMLQDLRRRLRDLRFRASSNKLKNVRQIKEVKRDIARILTISKKVDGNSALASRRRDTTTIHVNGNSPKADSTTVRVGGNSPKADSTTVCVGGNSPKADSTTVN